MVTYRVFTLTMLGEYSSVLVFTNWHRVTENDGQLYLFEIVGSFRFYTVVQS